MPYAGVGGVQYFYSEHGPVDAPLVLFVHGWGCDGHDWSWQVPAVSARYRAVVVDLAGHGLSGLRASRYRPIDFAADLGELATTLDWDRFDAVGHSLGGAVVDLLAVERPDLVRSLVLVDPAIELPEPDLQRAAAKAAAAVRTASLGPLRDLEAGGDIGVPPWLQAWRDRRLDGMRPSVAAAAYVGLREGPWDPMRPDEWLRALRLRQCPVLALHRDSSVARLEAETLRHPDSKVELWDACGHWFHVEQPDRFNARLLGWLDDRQALERIG